MPNQLRFEGLEVSDIEFEITGGGTHETEEVVNLGDTVEGRFTARVVNVKHPIKHDDVVRVQTLNVTEASIDGVIEQYKAPPKVAQPELGSVPDEPVDVPEDAAESDTVAVG